MVKAEQRLPQVLMIVQIQMEPRPELEAAIAGTSLLLGITSTPPVALSNPASK